MRIPKTLNPLINEDYTVDNILKLIFEPLFILDENLKPLPNIAKDYSFSSDGKILTINIKDGLFWHDGKPITAKDIVFSLDTIKKTPNSIYASALNKISGYSSKGSQVFIQYIEPYSWAIYNLCIPIIPQHYYEKSLDINSDAIFKPIGSGNFKFLSYRLANNLILEKTSNFKGQPYINKINVFFTPDRKTDLNSFEKNITDAIKVNFSEWGKLNFNRRKLDTKFITNEYEFLGFNYNNPLYKNIYFRRALAYSIPKDEIIQNIFLDTAVKASTPINPNAWNSSFQELENYEYNLEMAIKNLVLANVNLEQVKTSILINSENEQRIEMANLIAKNLKQIGINVEIISKPFNEYMESLKKGEFEMYLGGINFNNVPNFESFLGTLGTGEGGLNYSNYIDTRMDFFISNISKQIGEQNFLNACNQFEKYFSEQIPMLGICFKKEILLTDYTIQGDKKPNIYNQFNNIEIWHKIDEVLKND